MKKCLACGTERELDDGNDPECCPNCGRYYAKVEAIREAESTGKRKVSASVKRPTPKSSVSRVSPPSDNDEDDLHAMSRPSLAARWRELSELKRILILVLVSFVIGFFAGREQLKREIAESFKEAAENIGSIFTEGARPEPKKESITDKIKKALRKEPIVATMTKKGFYDGDYDDFVTFGIRFENKTDRAIRGFNGVIIVSDILDNVIKKLNVKITDPIDLKSHYDWSGQMEYNRFINSHRALKNADFEDIRVELETKKVLYQNGEVDEYN